MTKHRELSLLALAIIWLILNLSSLTTYLPPTCDESWYLSTAYQYVQHGRFGLPIVGNALNLEENHSGLGRGYLLILALIIRLFGITIYSRLFSLVGVAALVGATFITGKTLYNRRVGLWAAILNAFAWDVYARGHLLRPEIWIAAAVMLMPLLYDKTIAKPSVVRFIALGFVTALPITFHPIGLFFVVALGGLSVFDFATHRISLSGVVASGAGMVIGSALWLLTYLLPNLELAVLQWAGLGHSPVQAGIISLLDGMITWIWTQYLSPYGPAGLLQAVYLVVGVALFLRRRSTPSVRLAIFVLISLLLFAFLKVAKQPPTTVLWTPLGLLLTVGQVEATVSEKPLLSARFPPQGAWRLSLALLPLLSIYLIGDIWIAWKSLNDDYYTYVNEIKQAVPVGSSVMGQGALWFEFLPPDYAFLDDSYFELLANNGQFRPTSTFLSTEFERLSLDYVVVDGSLGCSTMQTSVGKVVTGFVERACIPVKQVDHFSTLLESPQTSIVYACTIADSSPLSDCQICAENLR